MCGKDKDKDNEIPQSSPMRDCWIEADFAKEYLDASISPRDKVRRIKNLKIASMLGIFSLIIISILFNIK